MASLSAMFLALLGWKFSQRLRDRAFADTDRDIAPLPIDAGARHSPAALELRDGTTGDSNGTVTAAASTLRETFARTRSSVRWAGSGTQVRRSLRGLTRLAPLGARSSHRSTTYQVSAQDAGWIVLLDRSGEPLARGHLLLQTGRVAGGVGSWDGRIESLRLLDGVEGLSTGLYGARFEENGETRPIDLVGFPEGPDPADCADIHWLDHELPLTLQELGGN